MSNTERSVFWICVILMMAMSFTSMMIALPRVCDIHSNINFDYQTMIVTILGIFITALIGWQIWATINANQRIERIEERVGSFNGRVTQLENSTISIPSLASAVDNLAQSHILFERALFTQKHERVQDYAMSYLFAMDALNILSELQAEIGTLIDSCLARMNSAIDNSQGIIDNQDISIDVKRNVVSSFNGNSQFFDAIYTRLLRNTSDERTSQLNVLHQKRISLQQSIKE